MKPLSRGRQRFFPQLGGVFFLERIPPAPGMRDWGSAARFWGFNAMNDFLSVVDDGAVTAVGYRFC